MGKTTGIFWGFYVKICKAPNTVTSMVGAQKNNYYTIIKLETLKLFKDLKYKIHGFTKGILGLRVKFSEGEFHPTLNSRLCFQLWEAKTSMKVGCSVGHSL